MSSSEDDGSQDTNHQVIQPVEFGLETSQLIVRSQLAWLFLFMRPDYCIEKGSQV